MKLLVILFLIKLYARKNIFNRICERVKFEINRDQSIKEHLLSLTFTHDVQVFGKYISGTLNGLPHTIMQAYYNRQITESTTEQQQQNRNTVHK